MAKSLALIPITTQQKVHLVELPCCNVHDANMPFLFVKKSGGTTVGLTPKQYTLAKVTLSIQTCLNIFGLSLQKLSHVIVREHTQQVQ